MEVFRDYQGREVRFTDERWNHVREGHDELIGFEFAIGETIASPDTVVVSNTNQNAHLYYRWYDETKAGGKYLCVVVIMLDDDAFVASAYLRNQVRRGRVIWARK